MISMNNLFKIAGVAKKTKSIGWVLVKSYLLIMTVSLILSILLFNFILQREVSYKLQTRDTQALNTFLYFVNQHLIENERISADLVTNEKLQEALMSDDNKNKQAIGKILYDTLIGRENIHSLHIIDREGNVISEYRSPVYVKDNKTFISQFDIQAINQKQGACYWGIDANILQEGMEPTFYMGRVIRSKSRLEPIGYMIIYLNSMVFQRESEKILENIQFEFMIKDAGGKSISFPEQSKLKVLEDKIKWENHSYHSIKYEGKQYYYTSKPIPLLNGQILGMSTHINTNSNISAILVFAIIVNIIFLSIASVVVKKRVIKPLEHIARKARTIGKQGKLDIKFMIDEEFTEVDDIVQALYEMMDEINILVREVREREKLQKRLELSIINHQVKPHFLYNTLNAASLLVAMEEKESANELIKTLAKYYRACLSSGEEMITIEEEIRIVKDYIKIAIIRNPNIAEIAYDVDESILKHMIPKITVQSLVENCIKYGIKELGKPVDISVKIKLDNQGKYIKVVVEDNGIGMQPEIIDKVMKGEKLNEKSGFGLRAIITRIQLYYDIKDIKDIIQIDSKYKEYTKITLKFPC